MGLLIDMLKMFGYQTCIVQAGVINISFGTFPLNDFLGTSGSIKMLEKHIRIFVYNSVEMYLFHDLYLHLLNIFHFYAAQNCNWNFQSIVGKGFPLFYEDPLYCLPLPFSNYQQSPLTHTHTNTHTHTHTIPCPLPAIFVEFTVWVITPHLMCYST